MPHPNASAPIRILLQTVGTGRDPNPATDDPGNPVWNALAFAVKEIQPDRLVQFCSQKTRAETIPKFDQAVETCPADRDTHVTENEDDVGELTFEYGEYIDRLRQQFPHAEFHADFTSGTKAMSAALMAAALSREIANLHYATGPRDAGGRVTRTTALQKLHTGDLVAERKLDELGRLFNHGEFGAVRLQAGELKRTVNRRTLISRASSLADLADVYKLWDRFQWNAANLKMGELINGERSQAILQDAGWDVGVLKSQRQHLIACEPKQPTRQRVADLLANVDRRLRRHQYDDAVSRLYRLTELFLQERFVHRIMPDRKKKSNPTKAVPKEVLEKHAPRVALALYGDESESKANVNLGATYVMQALAEAGDPLGERMWSDYTGGTGLHNPTTNGPLFKEMEMRNNSWLAHGSTPADETKSRAFRDSVETYLVDHFQSPPDKNQESTDLRGYLATIRFAECPWV